MKTKAMYLAGMLSAIVVTAAMAHTTPVETKAAVSRSVKVAMRGEIVDPQCYFTHDSRGMAHASCAAMCARGGQGLSFLDDSTGVVYPLIGKAHGVSQNAGLLPHLGKPVRVTGLVYHKAGGSVLLIQSVAVVAAKAK